MTGTDHDIFKLDDTRIGRDLDRLIALDAQRQNLACTTGICGLPTELISEIFLATQQLSLTNFFQPSISYLDDMFSCPDPRNYEVSHLTADESWMQLMLSCSALRAIAISTPQLWQHIGFPTSGNSQWRDLCAARAQGQNLHIYMSPTIIGCDDVLEIIALLPRAREAHLVLELLWWKGSRTMAQLCQPCPNLRSLSFLSKFTSNFLGGRSENLTMLVISVWDVASGPHLPNLRYLRLIQTKPPHKHDGNGRGMLAWLHQLPTIEVLSIILLEPPSGIYYSPAHINLRVYLPVLAILHIDADIDHVHDLLELLITAQSKTALHINIGNNRSRDLYTSYDRSIQRAYKDLLDCFRRCVRMHGATSVRQYNLNACT